MNLTQKLENLRLHYKSGFNQYVNQVRDLLDQLASFGNVIEEVELIQKSSKVITPIYKRHSTSCRFSRKCNFRYTRDRIEVRNSAQEIVDADKTN